MKTVSKLIAWRKSTILPHAVIGQGHRRAVTTKMLDTSLLGAAACGQLVKPVLLVSDLDDTLLGSTPAADAATAAFKAMWEASKASGTRCMLAINTGRTLPLWRAAWAAKQHLLPQPNVLIAGVGTRCYHYNPHTGSLDEDEGWTSHMREGWDGVTARAVMDDLISTYGDTNVEYRPDDELHTHKLTVLYKRGIRQQLLPHLHSQLQRSGLQATVIEGGSGKGPDWQFIDLLPRAAGKGTAMRYVQQQLRFDDASTVAAGDANNDLLMLQQAPHAILVGNAVPELKEWARQQQQNQQQLPQQAQETTKLHQQVVYVAQQPIAAGILEGLQALGMLKGSYSCPNGWQLPN